MLLDRRHWRADRYAGPAVPALLLASLTVACGDRATGPGTEPAEGIKVAAGASVKDTVDAPLPLALRVLVRDANGRAMPGVVVRFNSVPISRPGGYAVPGVLVGGLAAPGASSFLAETTSAQGIAFARIVMGRVAGNAAVAITVPQVGVSDTARFTVMPGAPVRLVMPIADSAIAIGNAVPLAGRVEDRYGNPRPDTIAYEQLGSGLTIADGRVSATAPARAAVIGRLDRSNIAPDTTWLSVVPVATVAVRKGTRLVTAKLDGSGLAEIPHQLEATDYGPVWHPNGQSLLAVLGTYSITYSLYRVDLAGKLDRLLTPTSVSAVFPYVPGTLRGLDYSPDGNFVFLSGNNCNSNAILYRFPAASPTSLERLSPVTQNDCFEVGQQWPSPSPDGLRVVFENFLRNGPVTFAVAIMTVATKAVTQLVAGQRPSWSPKGDLIAYHADRQIWVIRPDGTGAQMISPIGRSYLQGVQWSPDGQWLLARFQKTPYGGTTAALLNVSSRQEIPLPWANDLSLPVWKPVP